MNEASLLRKKKVNAGLCYGLMLGNMGFESKALIGWQDGYNMNTMSTKERDCQANTLFDQHFNRHQQDKRTKQAYPHSGKEKNSSAVKVFIYLYFFPQKY